MVAKWLCIVLFASLLATEGKGVFDTSPSERYIFLLIGRLGFGNRMKTLADWYKLAMASKRTLLVNWERTADCNMHFLDVFGGSFDSLQFVSDELDGVTNSLEAVGQLAESAKLSHVIFSSQNCSAFWAKGNDSFMLARALIMSEVQVIITDYDGALTVEGVSCQQYMTTESRFLNALVPKESIKAMVDDITSNYFSEQLMIGVHYRHHDPLQDWAVVPPLMNSFTATEFGEGATIDHFIEVMKKVEAKFTSVLSDGSKWIGCRFFVTSNSEEMKITLLETFPSAVALAGPHSRLSIEGMELAVTEWLLLAQSALIINTYGSSFAVTAAYMRLRPIASIWEGMIITYNNLLLPYCGHMQYVSCTSQQGSYSKYYEGTIDNREVLVEHNPVLFL